MAFTVHSRDSHENFDDEATFHFSEQGLLVVRTSHGAQRTYSPSGWDFVEQSISEGPNSYTL